LKIWLLWQIWRINLPYKNKKEQPSDCPYYQQVETSEKKLLFYEFSYEFAIRTLINLKFQTTIFLQKTEAGRTVRLFRSYKFFIKILERLVYGIPLAGVYFMAQQSPFSQL
jgi:hypothetical protein